MLHSKKAKKRKKNEDNPPIASVFDAYYEDGLKLNPLSATFEGDNRYNATFPNFLSDSFEKQMKEYYTNYKSKLADYNDDNLSESEKMTKAILNWECDVNLEGMAFGNYTPIDQMWPMNLMIGQLASGSSAQPFKTAEDYKNWITSQN